MSDHKPDAAAKAIRVYVRFMDDADMEFVLPDDSQTKTRLADFSAQLAGGELAHLEDADGSLYLMVRDNIKWVRISEQAARA